MLKMEISLRMSVKGYHAYVGIELKRQRQSNL